MAVAMGFMLTACDIETSHNGDLDGFWQLKAVDTLATGGHTDMRNANICWAVQGRLLQLWYGNYGFFCRFSHADGTLTLAPLHFMSKEEQDPLVTDVADVQRFGVNALNEQYQVVTLRSDKMVLDSPTLRLHFRKY